WRLALVWLMGRAAAGLLHAPVLAFKDPAPIVGTAEDDGEGDGALEVGSVAPEAGHGPGHFHLEAGQADLGVEDGGLGFALVGVDGGGRIGLVDAQVESGGAVLLEVRGPVLLLLEKDRVGARDVEE